MSNRLLLVDDEVKILDMIDNYLKREGFEIIRASNGNEALEVFRSQSFDLVVLDLMLPELNGLEVCKEIRRFSEVPIIMLTAKNDEIDKLLGLELGADDYISKPFSLRELTARIKAVLRRSKSYSPAVTTIMVNNLRLEPSRFELYVDDTLLTLTPTEFKLINALLEYPGQVFSRLQLLERAYGDIYEGYERSIDTHISNLRRKLEKAGSQISIKSIYGIGYKIEKEDNSNEDIP
jgi:two-component system OmpR family response regulator